MAVEVTSAPSPPPQPSRPRFGKIQGCSRGPPFKPPGPPKRRFPRLRRYFAAWQELANTYWIYETFSCVLALSSLGTLCGVLASLNGKARPQWPDYISTNTIVAILTAILKASLMLPIAEGISELKWQWYVDLHSLADIEAFDSASRGPWGAFLFLFHFKRHYLATFAAFVTVCALAVDPFSQQIIKYVDCPGESKSTTALIPRTNVYVTAGPKLVGPYHAISSDMAVSIYQGLVSPPDDPSSQIRTTCLSGNCTFSTDLNASYSSVAMCQTTTDISNLIQRNESLNWTHYYLPSIGEFYTTGQPLMTNVLSDNSAAWNFTFDAIMWTDIDQRSGSPNETSSVLATRSSIFPCIKTWGGNITRGVLVEQEVDSTPLMLESTEGDYIMVANQTLRDGVWHLCEPSTDSTDANTTAPSANATLTGEISGPHVSVSRLPSGTTLESYSPDCLWGFELLAVSWSITDFLVGFFANQTINYYLDGEVWIKRLYADGFANMTSINKYMDDLAASMTASIRSSNDAGDLPLPTSYARGKVWDSQTCIHVRWPWVALPASLVMCSIAFLLATIVSTRSGHKESYKNSIEISAGPFKSSPLPLLFHSVKSDATQANGNPRTLPEMQKAAEELNAEILQRPADDDWHFWCPKEETPWVPRTYKAATAGTLLTEKSVPISTTPMPLQA